jgi:hypothetical protein
MTDFPNFAQLREELADEELPALREAGLLSPATIDHLESYRRHYDPKTEKHYEKGRPAYYYHNTEYYVRVVRGEVGKNLREAVASGNREVVEHAVGMVDDSDVTLDFVDYENLAELVERPSLLFLLFGDTGEGKTMTAVRLAELWEMRVGGGTILTNILSFAEEADGVVYVEDYPSLIRYCVEHPRGRKLFVADELSSLMSGYAADRQYVETYMRPFVRKMRKEPFRLSIIGVGHRPGDIHPTLLNGELAYPAFKRGQKTMDVYHTLDTTESGEDEYCSVSGIGLPDYTVDTDDSGAWGWGTEDEIHDSLLELEEDYGDMLELLKQFDEEEAPQEQNDVDEEVIRRQVRAYEMYHEQGMSYGDVAEEMDMSKSTAHNAVDREEERRAEAA